MRRLCQSEFVRRQAHLKRELLIRPFSHSCSFSIDVAGCGVTPVIPISRFLSFSIQHLANKNFQRVGTKGHLNGEGSNLISELELSAYAKSRLPLSLREGGNDPLTLSNSNLREGEDRKESKKPSAPLNHHYFHVVDRIQREINWPGKDRLIQEVQAAQAMEFRASHSEK